MCIAINCTEIAMIRTSAKGSTRKEEIIVFQEWCHTAEKLLQKREFTYVELQLEMGIPLAAANKVLKALVDMELALVSKAYGKTPSKFRHVPTSDDAKSILGTKGRVFSQWDDVPAPRYVTSIAHHPALHQFFFGIP